MRLPNVLCVGLAKSGTTALWYYFSQHPDVFVSTLKETNYFVHDQLKKGNQINSLEKYQALFSEGTDHACMGEISPSYLVHYRTAANRILETLGKEVSIIVLLRNPVERVYSRYLGHIVRDQNSSESFEEVLPRLRDVEIVSPALNYFIQVFGKEKVGIFLSEELSHNTDVCLREIWKFMGVKNFKVQKDVTINKSGRIKSRKLHDSLQPGNKLGILKRIYHLLPNALRARLLNKIKNLNMEAKPAMNPKTRESLELFFQEEVKELSRITGQDLEKTWYKTIR